MIKIAYFVDDNWQDSGSGVHTFIQSIRDDWVKRYDCQLIKFPEVNSGQKITELPSVGSSAEGPQGRKREQENRIKLALGYVKDLFSDVRFIWSVREKLKGRIIVCNEFGCETLPIALRIVNPGKTVISIAHTHPGVDIKAGHPVRRFVERVCYTMISGIVFNSYSAREEWKKKLGLTKIPKGTVILHGIEKPDCRIPEDYPQQRSDTIDFGCVARFASWKGQRELLSAWSLLPEKVIQNSRLIFVGDGPLYEDLRGLVQKEHLTDKIIFLGQKKNGSAYFNGADVGVQLSTEPEAFGLVLLEAMSRGKPVMASRLGGIPEVVEDGKTGYLVDPFDPEEVAKTISELAGSREKREHLGQGGFERWKEHFQLKRMLDDYDVFFRKFDG